MIWSHVAMLVQASVAFHVRVMMRLVGQVPGRLASLKVTTTPPLQPSDAVADPVKLVPVWPQAVFVSAGQVIKGSVVSSVQEMTCVQVLVLLQASTAV